MRADARRNRERVLEAAIEAFAADGLGVPVQEIARRAGVGTGTVSRHFPTKQALYDAIVQRRVELLVHKAEELGAELEPGPAFFALFEHLVTEGRIDHGLADALSRGGYDLDEAAARTGSDVLGVLGGLLVPAQQAGAVRRDVDVADVKALIAACLSRQAGTHDPEAHHRMVAIVRQGLQDPG